VMMRHFFSIKKDVEVDECPGCGGFWLDAGELGRIRSLFKTEEERNKATDDYYSEIFDNQLPEMNAKAEKAQSIANMFRFICPSYYIPGKQNWGAF
jgi:Zn-finger nucleic acid-binding protein